MNVTNLGGKTALVTGAGSGIGRATATAFARRGANLVLCDLNEAALAETSEAIRQLGRSVQSHTVDVADPDAMCTFADTVHEQLEAVDILMNNAGVGLGGGALHTSLEDWDWIIGINLRGVIHGCHYFLPAMVKRGRGGHVVNVSSMAGYFATEALTAYCTTKFGVLGFSEALREEVAPHGIGVTAICPGIINTPITATSPYRGPDAAPETRQYAVEMYQRRNYTADRVAAGVLKAIHRNRAVAPISPEAWAAYYLKRFAPWLLARLSRTLRTRSQREIERRRGTANT
jgi:NAD(P)-dependent dehydrogenase (short-subunit alcohol dehydrogenase family)